ncbi:hypothetical protein ACTXT7_011596 [Hymenolepis weldensis]
MSLLRLRYWSSQYIEVIHRLVRCLTNHTLLLPMIGSVFCANHYRDKARTKCINGIKFKKAAGDRNANRIRLINLNEVYSLYPSCTDNYQSSTLVLGRGDTISEDL